MTEILKKISSKAAHELLMDLSHHNRPVKFSGTIQGNSMLPWIREKDVITISPVISKICVGDIVAFYDKHHARLIAHRAIKITDRHITTKGDNCFQPDPSMNREDIAGKVTEIYRNATPVNFGVKNGRFLILILSRINILPFMVRLFNRCNFL